MKKIFKIILIYLTLVNLSSAGIMINSPIDNSNNSKGINYKNKGGNVYNNEGTIINSTIDNSNNSKGINYKTKGGGKIYIKNGYIDAKKCYQKLNIPYDEKKVKITIVDNQNIKINNKTIKINECLIKNK